jgi:hypothetical protein
MTGANVDLNASRVTTVIVCYSVPIPFMLLFTGLRLFIKFRPSSKNPMALDDYVIIGATVRTTRVVFISTSPGTH